MAEIIIRILHIMYTSCCLSQFISPGLLGARALRVEMRGSTPQGIIRAWIIFIFSGSLAQSAVRYVLRFNWPIPSGPKPLSIPHIFCFSFSAGRTPLLNDSAELARSAVFLCLMTCPFDTNLTHWHDAYIFSPARVV